MRLSLFGIALTVPSMHAMLVSATFLVICPSRNVGISALRFSNFDTIFFKQSVYEYRVHVSDLRFLEPQVKWNSI